MRPASIVNFERLYLGGVALGVLNSFLTWDQQIEQLKADPNTAAAGSGILLVTTIISVLIPLLLWFFIARKASVVAKWILVVLFVIGLIVLAVGLSQGTLPSGIGMVLAVVSFLMQAAAVYMLFRSDAKAWFSDGRGEVDANDFR